MTYCCVAVPLHRAVNQQLWQVVSRPCSSLCLVLQVDFTYHCTVLTSKISSASLQLAEDEAGDLTVTHEASLGGHAKMVNCVRFSPTGVHLMHWNFQYQSDYT